MADFSSQPIQSYYQTHAFNPYNLNTLVPRPPPASVPPPPPPAVDQAVASRALRRLITNELKNAGFGGTHNLVMERIEMEVTAFMSNLYASAHQHANLANRSGPIMTDVLLACKERNMQTKDLRKFARKTSRKKKRHPVNVPELKATEQRDSSPDLLPSDDEASLPHVPLTLRTLPRHYPHLPPKHTYLRTPAVPPKKAALPSLEKKLKTAALVQESLRNLLIGTEDTTNQEDAELLGHIVNWEAGMHPRKRWRVPYYMGATGSGAGPLVTMSGAAATVGNGRSTAA